MILIVGSLPETSGVGGVTIHVARLCGALDTSGVQYQLCDYKRVSIFKQIRMIRNSSVVHLHVSNPWLRFFYVILCRLLSKSVILTFHGNLGRYGKVKNWADLQALRFCDVPVLINNISFQKALPYNGKAVMISAYIPPMRSEDLLDEMKKMILKLKAENKIMVATNASYMQYSLQGDEVYGIRFLVDYFKTRHEYALIISDPSGQYAESYLYNEFSNVCFITERHSFAALLAYSDIMIRATFTDGDSLSVREALAAGLKVIATDCVDRPCGVVLMRYNDAESLTAALSESPHSESAGREENDVVDSIVRLYNDMIYG